MGQERFPGEHSWEPGMGGQERGAPSTARRVWGREAALRADTKSCNYIVTAQKQESWERLRLGNQCWYQRQCRSPLLPVLPAWQRVSGCPLPPIAARRCPSLPAAHALSPQSWTAALPARGAGTGAESLLRDPGCSTAGEGQTPVSPPGWGSSLPGGDGGLCGTGVFWLNPPLLGSLMQAAPAKPEAPVAMAMPER